VIAVDRLQAHRRERMDATILTGEQYEWIVSRNVILFIQLNIFGLALFTFHTTISGENWMYKIG
jgi:acyl-ACP thioesterase